MNSRRGAVPSRLVLATPRLPRHLNVVALGGLEFLCEASGVAWRTTEVLVAVVERRHLRQVSYSKENRPCGGVWQDEATEIEINK